MLRLFAMFVALYGIAVMAIPWVVGPELHTAIRMIVTGTGVVIVGSALTMWRKPGSEPH